MAASGRWRRSSGWSASSANWRPRSPPPARRSVGFAESAARATIATENQAKTLGLSIEQYEGLKYAAGQVGLSTESFTRGLERFAARMGNARDEAEKLAAQQAKQAGTVDQLADKNRQLSDAVDSAALAADRAKSTVATSFSAIQGADQSLDHAQRALKKLKDEFGSPIGGSDALKERFKDAELAVTRAQEAATAARERQRQAIEAQRHALEKLADTERKRNDALRTQLTKQNATADQPEDKQGIISQIAALGSGSGAVLTQLGAFADKFNSLKDATHRRHWRRPSLAGNTPNSCRSSSSAATAFSRLSEEEERLKVTPTDPDLRSQEAKRTARGGATSDQDASPISSPMSTATTTTMMTIAVLPASALGEAVSATEGIGATETPGTINAGAADRRLRQRCACV